MDPPPLPLPADDGGRMNVHELVSSTRSNDASNETNNDTARERTESGSAPTPLGLSAAAPVRPSVTISRQNSSTGSRIGYASRVKKPRPDSGSSRASAPALEARSSVLSRLSSVSGAGGLRDTFFGSRRDDPLELSTSQEFDLTVIDESGGMEPNIVGQILSPDIGDWSSWSAAGYVVVIIGVATVVITAALAVAIAHLDGYSIDPGLVFGSLQTLILCAIVFMTYHGVQSFQAHPNPLILYKCVIDMVLALRFLLDPLLQDWHVYTPGLRNSCKYLSAVTQFLYLSSDCWYFALIVDLYLSLTNPFTSVKADRRRYKLAIYSISALSALMTAVIERAHGFSDGAYCWTHRGNSRERNFFRLNVASWLLFYDWMILFYLSGIAVLIFCAKRLRSGLRDTLQTRRDMLRNGTISIMSFTAYWTIVFTWYAVSFHTRTHYELDGTMSPSKIFRSYAYSLSGRGAVDYFVWFMLNRPSQIKANWLRFSAESADKKFSAQLNTALQHELIYFTIEGMTRAIQMADDELHASRDRSPTPQRASELDHGVSDRLPPLDSDRRERQPSRNDGDGRASASGGRPSSYDSPPSSATTDKKKRKNPIKGDTFDIPRVPAPPASASKSVAKHPASAALPPALPVPSGPPPPLSRRKGSTSSSYNHIRFTPYKPEVFAELRSAFGIAAADFLTSFQTSTKPNISEGASGAFLFFSGDRKFLVKSMAESECRFLCEIADEYVDFLIANPSSLITKFFGCFKITLYEKKFYFVVMENLFAAAEQATPIHHRFDIKGSWVNRSYKRPRRGVKVKCRHCSMQFKVGAKKALLQCPNVVGLHEPNVVLKDNDLRTRMRIGRDAGRELYELLREDSLFLCRLGIMDYSLLLGVVDIEFLVDGPQKHAHSRRNTATSATPDGPNSSFMTVNSSLSVNDDDLDMADAAHRSDARTESLESLPSGHSSARSVTPVVDLAQHTTRARGDTQTSALSLARAKKTMRRSKRIFGPGYYYIGVIDILQTWTLQKRLERFWKVNVQRCDPDGLSAIEPVAYQRRFEAKLREVIALPKDYVAMLNRRRMYPSIHGVGGFDLSRATAVPPARRSAADAPVSRFVSASDAMAPGAAMTGQVSLPYADNEVDIDVLIETGGRSGRGGTRAASGAAAAASTVRRRVASEDDDDEDLEASDTSRTNSSAVDDLEDLEQAQRNPEPILLRFSNMLLGSSTRSNMTNVSSQRDAV